MNPWTAEFLEAALICHDENPELEGKTIFDFSRGAVRGVEAIRRHLDAVSGATAYVSVSGFGEEAPELEGLRMRCPNPVVGEDGKIYFE